MRIRHSLLAILAVAIAGCSGSGEADHSLSGVKRSADGLLIVPSLGDLHDPIPDPSPAGLGPNPKRYIIWWPKDEIGWNGYFDFVVHPTQMFLRSSSTETSPSEALLWVYDISPDQYRAIGDLLDRQSSTSFMSVPDRNHEGYTLFLFKSGKPIPRFTNSTDAQTWYGLFDGIMNRNLDEIVRELNRNLPSDVEPLFSQPSIAPMDRRLKIRQESEEKLPAE